MRHIRANVSFVRQLVAKLAEAPPGVSNVEFARRSGVGRATIHRLATGTSEPTIATLRELAIAHGYDLDLRLVPLSDPNAAAALRHLVDPAFEKLIPADVDAATAREVGEWISRLERYDDIDRAAVAAARASALLEREAAVYLRGEHSAARLASAGDASGKAWAISGASGLEFVTGSVVNGVGVLWVDGDAESAARTLYDTHRRVENSAGANVVVARAHPSVFIDVHQDGPIRFVAPTQLMLDSIGLGGLTEVTALDVQRGWSEDGVV